MSWPLTLTVTTCLGWYMVPVGRLAFAVSMAEATSPGLTCRAAMADGSSWTRTAYLAAPHTVTCATPGTIDMR